MTWTRRRRIVGILLALAVAQGIAILIYRTVENNRRLREDSAFRYERLSSNLGPDLSLLSIDGSKKLLSHFRGKVVLLHFWATWCPPCREELPGLLKLGRDLSKDGRLQVLAVSVDTNWDSVRDFFGGAVPPEIVRDELGVATAAYDLSTLPDTYLLAADGSLRVRFSGARDWRSQHARDIVLEHSKGTQHE